MVSIFEHPTAKGPDGRRIKSYVPFSPDESKRLGFAQWFDVGGCPDCAAAGRLPAGFPVLRYVEGDQCGMCLQADGHAFAAAVARGEAFSIEPIPMSTEEAQAAGVDFFYPGDLCPKGPHLIRKPLNGSGGCLICREQRAQRLTPRQQAIAAGKAWYTPEKPCKVCGTRSPRRVVNGECQGCKPPKAGLADGRRTADSVLVESAPDLVMDREQARELGFKVFRTGRPCRRGHRGYRYVSTGGCIECKKRGGR